MQRHAEGEELPQKDQEVSEIAEKGAKSTAAAPPATPAQAPTAGVAGAEETATPAPGPAKTEDAPVGGGTGAAPAATRTADEEKKETEAGTKAGGQYEAAQKLSPGAQSLAGAQAVLQGVYGGMKKIVPGNIVILADQPACSRKYDEVCIADGIKRPDGSDWKIGDTAKDDAAAGVTTEGFQWKGVIYVNGKTTLVTATVHEMLHGNVSAGFRDTVGETFNEGATEYLARKALGASGVTVPATTAYPDQVKMTTDLVSLVGEDALLKGYFTDVKELVSAYEAKGSKTFAELKTAAEALNTSDVADALKPKAATPAKAALYEPTEI